MSVEIDFPANYSTAEGRWAAVGPYYAMFPQKFAYEKVLQYTSIGDKVLDPFAGRGTSIYYAAIQGRKGLGIEINPLGWLYGRVKLNASTKEEVEKKLDLIDADSANYSNAENELPEFFHYCFSAKVRSFLLAARELLDWRNKPADATLMALLLVNLHGNRDQSLSNQMRQTKSMAPAYSIQWWKDKNLQPPDVDPIKFLKERIAWRFAKGVPKTVTSKIILGNTLKELPKEADKISKGLESPYKLLLTSPPYHNITNYEYDQWLRFWMLGGPSNPTSKITEYTSRYAPKKQYIELLDNVFKNSAIMMHKNAIIYVRTDAREFTKETTIDILKKHFPKKAITISHTVKANTQTSLFGDKSLKPGEVDIVVT